MSEIREHFWCNGLTPGGILTTVDYRICGYVLSPTQGWTDTVYNIPRLSIEQLVCSDQEENLNKSKICSFFFRH